MTILPNEPNDLSNTNIMIQPILLESNLSGNSIYSMYFKMTRKILCYTKLHKKKMFRTGFSIYTNTFRTLLHMGYTGHLMNYTEDIYWYNVAFIS